MRKILALTALLFTLSSAQEGKIKLTNPTMDSTHGSFDASKALDGKTDNGDVSLGHCAHSNGGSQNPWWKAEVQLPGDTVIDRVNIFIRRDCCWNRYVNVKIWTKAEAATTWKLCKNWGNELIGYSQRGWAVAKCPENTKGKYIKIEQGNNQPLQLCEVEAYTTEKHGGDDACSASILCGIGEGDCDSDSHCTDDLKCGKDNCDKSIFYFDHDDDCCYQLGYKNHGCWNARSTDKIASLEGIAQNLVGSNTTRHDAINKCYLAALGRGYQYFTLQHGGQCASSATAGSQYNKYGSSTKCENGKGGKEEYSVYEIRDLQKYGSPLDISRCSTKAEYLCRKEEAHVVKEIINPNWGIVPDPSWSIAPNQDYCELACCRLNDCIGFDWNPVSLKCRLTSSPLSKVPLDDNLGLTTCTQKYVYGGWSRWTQWSSCSIPCTKSRTRTRTCSKPPPRPGFNCIGKALETLTGMNCTDDKINNIETSFTDAIIGAYQGVNDGSKKWSTLRETISTQKKLLHNCLHVSYTRQSYCNQKAASTKYCKLYASYTSVLYMLGKLPKRRPILTNINHNEALKTEAFKSFQHKMTLNLEQVKKMIVNVDKSFRKDFGNYLSQIAEYDIQIAKQDKVYISDIIANYKIKIEDQNKQISNMLINVIGVMIGKAGADIFTAGVKFVTTLAMACNPLGWVFGNAEPGNVEEALTEMADGINAMIKAGRLFAKLAEVARKAQRIQQGLTKNARIHHTFFKLLELQEKSINQSDIADVALQFTDAYGAFSPQSGLKKEELVGFTSLLRGMYETACDEISNSKSALGNGFSTGLFATGYCQGTKIGPMIDELDAVFEESFDAQFEIMDVGAALARSLIAKSLALKVKNVMEVGEPSILDYVLGITASATYRREVIFAACDAFEYRNFGNINDLCVKLKEEPMSNEITTLAHWVNQANQLNCDTSHRDILIPAYSGATQKGHINLDNLYNGKAIFQIPDVTYARKNDWILKADPGKAVYVKQFMLFMPPGDKMIEREDEISIIYGGPNVLNNRTFYLPPNEIVSSYTYNRIRGCHKIKDDPYSYSYCPSPFSSKTCGIRFGETYAKYLPSLYGKWYINLMNNQRSSQILLDRLMMPNVKGTIYLQARVKTCSNTIRSGGGRTRHSIQRRSVVECCGTKNMVESFGKDIRQHCKECPPHSVPSLQGHYCRELYKPAGCWRDVVADRAIPTLEGNSNLDGYYKSRSDALNKCYKAALANGYQYFAVQNGGWCASSSTAGNTYKKYGSSDACSSDGEGGPDANAVYKIINNRISKLTLSKAKIEASTIDPKYPQKNLIDGDLTTRFATKSETKPTAWVKLTLHAKASIFQIRFYIAGINGADSSYLSNSVVTVGNKNEKKIYGILKKGEEIHSGDRYYYAIDCHGAQGYYIKLQKRAQGFLSIAEMEVYGVYTTT